MRFFARPAVLSAPIWAAAWTIFSVLPVAQGGELAPARAPGGTPVPVAVNPAITAAQAQRKQQAMESMARTTQALQAMQAAQASARALAASGPNNLGMNPNQPGQLLPNVPNGLEIGGLVPDAGLAQSGQANAVSTWMNARTPVQTSSGGRTLVTVEQTAAQALLNWQTFNIGRDTTLKFDQSAGGASQSQWVAFNRIQDPSGVPSQILGSIQAPGQVYVINQNGIIFGGTSQVNTHALVASSLPINDNLVQRGLLNNPDQQFLFSQLTIPKISQGTMEAFVPPAPPNTPNGRNGDIIVQAGAQLTSPTTADKVGGRIALIGPNVSNAGTISTPDGQTILAAGNQVALFAHDSNDPTLRGLDVYVGAVDANSGTATNSGLIDAPRANTSIAGKTVNQAGIVNSSTSVSLNGRVDLLANYDAKVVNVSSGTGQVPKMFSTKSGIVNLGQGSVTQILPEISSTEKVVGTQLALNSQINLQGQVIHLGGNSTILAPSADANLTAGQWFTLGQGYSFVNTSGQVYLDQGARIDVAGSIDVEAPVSQNIVAVELRGSELADSSLLRNGVLRGQTILVDIRQAGIYNGKIWKGTPLADASGYEGLIERSVGELTVDGGSVSIKAGGSVVMQAGSGIDVSGGWINYEGGVVKTTKLMYKGHLIDIAQATPDRIYDGVDNGSSTTHTKWGITEEWGTSLASRGSYQKDYTYGGAGGTISILSPSVALDGNLLGQTVQGPRQTIVLPQSAYLNLSFLAQTVVGGQALSFSPTPPSIVFQENKTLAAADPFALDSTGAPLPLRADRQNSVELSPDLTNKNGFGSLTITNSDGNILVPAGVSLKTSPGGAITLTGSNINIQGQVSTAGGTQTYTVYDFSPYANVFLPPGTEPLLPPYDPTRGNFILGSAGILDAAGMIVDSQAKPYQAGVIQGGSISIAANDVNLSPGSVVDVSGGVTLSSAGRFGYGDAGSISLKAGQDPIISPLLGGELSLGAVFKGYSGAKGGSLALQTTSFQIGGATADANTLLLSPEYFTQGGFSAYSILGLGQGTAQTGQYVPGLVVAPNVVIAPVAESWVAMKDGFGPIVLSPTLKPEGLRNPVSLTLGAIGVQNSFPNGPNFIRGDVVVAAGSVIRTDAGGSVTLQGHTIDFLGSIFAPGGSITLNGATNSIALFPDKATVAGQYALPTVHLGANSLLSSAGTTVLTPDSLGYRSGLVLDGGNIQVAGNIVAEAGSVLDVSGTSAVLDYLPSFSLAGPVMRGALTPGSRSKVATLIATNGGSIALKGGQGMFIDSTLKGGAGGANASGGSLVLSSGQFVNPNSPVPTNPTNVTLTVSQSGSTIPPATNPAGLVGIGQLVLDADGAAYAGHGYVKVDRFQGGGFDFLTLGGNKGMVEFSGPVNIAVARSLRVGDGGFISADAQVNLTSSYVALGANFLGPLTLEQQAASAFVDGNQAPFYQAPTYGAGRLTVRADLIDVGNLSLQNIGAADLIADNGDIRGDGTLNIAGDLTLRAGQIYPTTAVTFSIEAYNHGGTEGSVTIQSSGVRPLPLSGGGTLNVYAAAINQGGVLRAPIGTINLGWNGSGTTPLGEITNTAVPVARQVTLSSGSVTSVSAIDPVSGQGVLIPYGTNLNGTSWIDPSGIDITGGGLPSKTINISATNIDTQAGSTMDVRGGGDLYAYRWVKGIGGTQDVLGSTTTFAVIPSYQGEIPFDPGYANSSLKVGDKVYLKGGGGLAPGYYTLLPARYALLPGSFVVSPKSIVTNTSITQADGSTLVPGYRLNGQNDSALGGKLFSSFEVASSEVVRNRAEYQDYSANSFLRQSAMDRNVAVPRLPMDSGRLILAAAQSLALDGRVSSRSISGGLGSQVDISSSSAIRITAPGGVAGSGELVLNSASLSAFGADSLLIGGVRSAGSTGTSIKATTSSLTVDNAGSSLSGADIVLVSNGNLTLASGSRIESSGSAQGGDEIFYLGDSAVAGSGDGSLVRVSADPAASIVRQGVSNSTVPNLMIQSGATLAGTSLILDSTAKTTLSATAILSGQNVSVSSDRVSLQLDNPGALQPNSGLVLSNANLDSLQATARNLTLLSYSSIDFYGTGSIGSVGGASDYSLSTLRLSAAEIRSFNNGGGAVELNAGNIVLDNSPGRTGPGSVSAPAGSLVLNAGTVQFGANQLNILQVADVTVNASRGILVQGAGELTTAGSLNLNAPVLTGATGSKYALTASGGALTVSSANASGATVSGGLGASLALKGTTVTANGNIVLPSGTIELRATSGDVVVNGNVNADGTAKRFFDYVEYTGAGRVNLVSDQGSVVIGSGGIVSVSAQAAGGGAGTLQVDAGQGSFIHDGTILGRAGSGGSGGNFFLDAATLDVNPGLGGNDLSPLVAGLSAGGFNQTLGFRIRGGGTAGVNNDVFVPVGTTIRARSFSLSSDRGSIVVAGIIDASGQTGGKIALQANGSVTLADGSVLDASAQNFDNAGKGGSVLLEAGSQTNGVFSNVALGSGPQVDIQTGSAIRLDVARNTNATTAAANQSLGLFGGTLHLRAPQSIGNNEVQIRAINGSITGASKIVVEGYQVFTPAAGAINSVTAAVEANGTNFSGNTDAIANRLLAGNAGLATVTVVTPGAEIINLNGNLTLTSDWDLGALRFGPKNAAGILTLRAKGDIVMTGSLSDGFTTTAYNSTLLAQNTALPVNAQSWSYRLAAGSDFSAADFHQVLPTTAIYDPVTGLALPGTATGSLLLGVLINNNNGIPIATNNPQTVANAIAGRYQVIRTGTGDIDISTAGDILLRNQFASIFTVGTLVNDPTLSGNFDTPILRLGNSPAGVLLYPAQYTLAGGNITLSAEGNIAHVTRSSSGQIVLDSQMELPNNWLYRRGYVSANGDFGAARWGDVASTSWWVDFSNFFEGVGALGGGNVTLTAGHDISNVDAVIPTNSRTTKQTALGDKKAANQTTIELGGGDLIVQAGRNIDAGVYYVERGQGTLRAGGDIVTNSTRSASLGTFALPAQINDSHTWLPTTLFLGKGSFDVAAGGDLLLGPTANPFLLPQAVNNSYWYKTYFSTYAPTSTVQVQSLTGDVTLRQSAISSDQAQPLLYTWFNQVNLFDSSAATLGYYQPWLRLTETLVGDPFRSIVALQPGTLRVSAFSGDINTVGDITLSPSPTGTVDLMAAGSINALQPSGVTDFLVANSSVQAWTSTSLNLSDANPAAIPGLLNPFAYQSIVGVNFSQTNQSTRLDLSFINNLFAESGSILGTYGVIQTKQNLHANLNGAPLHAGDSNPLRIYAGTGDISGLTLFSGKPVQVMAGQDIADVALYVQNLQSDDVSIVSAGRNIVIYNPNSALRTAAQASGNAVDFGSGVLAGDIQINGPGTLQVLAGADLDLGVGPNNLDGTGLGVTSIGNKRNPVLSSSGANIVAGAGLGTAPDYASFIAQFVNTPDGAVYLRGLGLSPQAFNLLSREQQERVALDVFYLVLRDAGRKQNDPDSEGGYATGFAAIQALFPAPGDGDISLTSREFKTLSGGNISLFAPGGGLTVGFDAGGNQALDQGVLTEAGGSISIFTRDDVVVGTSRIFTLRGGDIVIWSSDGDIAAGASSKTVQSAPPTRVLIDPQSGDVVTDLAGLATGGGIGVLDTVEGVLPGDVDLIAPNGTVDAGDAGIRVSGNLNISAVQVLNASNIQTGGSNTGGTVATVAAPNVSGLTAGSNAVAATSSTAAEMAKQVQEQNETETELPSIISVEVLGYGGDSDDESVRSSNPNNVDQEEVMPISYNSYRDFEKKS